MTLKKALATAAVVPLVLGVGAAEAAKKPPAKKPTCNIIKDATGDATDTGLGVASPNDATLDIVGGDIATNATTLTAIIRVSSVTPTQTEWQVGRAYDLTFTVRGAAQVVRAVFHPGGVTTSPSAAKATSDAAKKEIRIDVPIASLKTPFKPNDKITQISANAWRFLGPTEATLGKVDQAVASSPNFYTASWPSCTKVGS